MSTAHIQQAIRATILAQHKLRTRVQCPASVPRRAGESFTCYAYLDAGRYSITAVEMSSSGRVRYENSEPLRALDIAKVQRAIELSIRSQRHLRARVVCPPAVLQQIHLRFTCIATIGSRGYPFEVTETDANGHVAYVGQ